MKSLPMSPESKRFLLTASIIIGGCVLTPFLISVLLPYLKVQFLDVLDTKEILTAFAIILSGLTLTIGLASESFKYAYSAKRQIAIKANVQNDIVTIACSFENKSKNRIIPQHFCLFIDEGNYNSQTCFWEFADILCHVNNDGPDCELGKFCKDGGSFNGSYPSNLIKIEYTGKFHGFYHLQHLHPKSITYIDPGEYFSEDATVRLKPGVYRAILVATSKNQDCVCANIQFVVEPSKIFKEDSQ
ncbi:MAG: hypothetical protein LBU43_04705 [Candidatus Accumulibacter sp.]|jgi:hypothetical protein|nr:hypothetical protein [Accumulibacter sp.]